MESTSVPNRIHLSQELVDLLLEAGKSHWVKIREDRVVAKGKGVLNTYWLDVTAPDLADTNYAGHACTETASLASSGPQESGTDRPSPGRFVDQNQGLVEWNVNIMKGVLADVISKRQASGVQAMPPKLINQLEKDFLNYRTSIKEVQEIVYLPKYNAEAAGLQQVSKVELSKTVAVQLRSYIYNLSTMYNRCPFHNFQHATHVTMSVVKLMSRIVAPEQLDKNSGHSSSDMFADLHDHTYGITSDPLTQFAVLLSALVSFSEPRLLIFSLINFSHWFLYSLCLP